MLNQPGHDEACEGEKTDKNRRKEHSGWWRALGPPVGHVPFDDGPIGCGCWAALCLLTSALFGAATWLLLRYVIHG